MYKNQVVTLESLLEVLEYLSSHDQCKILITYNVEMSIDESVT